MIAIQKRNRKAESFHYIYDFSPATKNYKPLTRQEEIQTIKLAQSGDQSAINTIIEKNLPFVVTIAKHFHHKEMQYLISDGIMGLIRAVQKYDPEKNIKFISYAVWWIKQSIFAHITDDQIVRIPKGIQRAVKTKSKNNFGSAYSASQRARKGYLSLDQKIDGTDNLKYADVIADDNIPEEIMIQKDLTQKQKEIVKNLLKRLTPRDRDIIKHRFMLNGKKKLTLQELGEKYNISKERVRQIQNNVLKQMRNILQKRRNNEIGV